MKVAVVGCGAVGSFYGAKLAQAGHELHFLLRSDYDVVRREGLQIKSPAGDFRVHPLCARTPQEIGPCDLVLIGLKTTANSEYPNLVPPLVDETTAVLTLQNGLGNVEQLARFVPPAQILGGLCFVCLNRLRPGLIHHIDHGAIVIGEFRRGEVARAKALAEVFRDAGVVCKVSEDLARAHWEKLTWNIPFNGLGVAAGAGYEAVMKGSAPERLHTVCTPTDQLLTEPHWEQLIRELILEVITAAAALGWKLPQGIADEQIARTRTMGAYKASTLLDFELGRPLELDSLFCEPLRRARAAGVEMPRLSALCQVLIGLDALRAKTKTAAH